MARLVIVWQDHDISATQEFGVRRFPLFCALRIARCWHVPCAQQFDFAFALDDQDQIILSDCLDKFRQPIRHD
ncbi:MAG: hypothetical protein WAM72_17510, partial [Xanthobacteraceae bacterium]